MEKVCVSYSLGKDSTLALYRTLKTKKVTNLVISVNENDLRSWFHGVDYELIELVSKSLNIPVILAKSKGEDYRERFIEALEQSKQLGAMACVFGDIDIEEHYTWCNEVCRDAGLKSDFPLWQENRRSIVEEFINSGFKAKIKTVSKQHNIKPEFLNQTLTHDVITEFEQLGIDVCGENGEYHTFVYDGPLYSFPIDTAQIDTYESEYAYSAVLEVVYE